MNKDPEKVASDASEHASEIEDWNLLDAPNVGAKSGHFGHFYRVYST